MFLRVLPLFLFAFSSHAATPTSTAQSFPENVMKRPNAFVFEALGRGGLYSLNYERALTPQVSLGAGVSYWPETEQTVEFGETNSRVLALPLYGNVYLHQANRTKVFATGGITWAFASAEGETVKSISGNGPIGTLGVGYEFRSNEKKYLLRVTPQLLIGDEIVPWIGLSVGLLAS